MRFATIGHFLDEKDIKHFPDSLIHKNLIVSPELNVKGTSGYISGLTLCYGVMQFGVLVFVKYAQNYRKSAK